jgi:hypothetical protein
MTPLLMLYLAIGALLVLALLPYASDTVLARVPSPMARQGLSVLVLLCVTCWPLVVVACLREVYRLWREDA